MCLYTGVSLQPAVQTTSSRLYSHQTSFILWSTIPVSSERSSLTSSLFVFWTFFIFENKVVIVPGADNHFLFQFVWHASRAVLLFALRCLGTSQSGHPTKTTREKEGGREESEYNPVYCSHAHLLSLTPPGTRSDLCGDLAPSLLSLMRFPSALGKSHQIPCALQELSGGPSWRLASSRLPWLLFGSAVALLCRVRLFAWQQRLQRLSH